MRSNPTRMRTRARTRFPIIMGKLEIFVPHLMNRWKTISPSILRSDEYAKQAPEHNPECNRLSHFFHVHLEHFGSVCHFLASDTLVIGHVRTVRIENR